MPTVDNKGDDARFRSIASEDPCDDHQDKTVRIDSDREEYGTPLPPAYESPVLDYNSILPLYDQAVLSLTTNTRRDHSHEISHSSNGTLPRQLLGQHSLEIPPGVFSQAPNPMNNYRLPQTPRPMDANAMPFAPHDASRLSIPQGENSISNQNFWNDIYNRTPQNPAPRARYKMLDAPSSSANLELHDLLGTMQLLDSGRNNMVHLSDRTVDTRHPRNKQLDIVETTRGNSQREHKPLPSMPISLHRLPVPNDQRLQAPLMSIPGPNALFQQTYIEEDGSDPLTGTNSIQHVLPVNNVLNRAKYPRSVPLQRLLNRRLASVAEETSTTGQSEASNARRCVSESTATYDKKCRPCEFNRATISKSCSPDPAPRAYEAQNFSATASPQPTKRSKSRSSTQSQRKQKSTSTKHQNSRTPSEPKARTIKYDGNRSTRSIPKGKKTQRA